LLSSHPTVKQSKYERNHIGYAIEARDPALKESIRMQVGKRAVTYVREGDKETENDTNFGRGTFLLANIPAEYSRESTRDMGGAEKLRQLKVLPSIDIRLNTFSVWKRLHGTGGHCPYCFRKLDETGGARSIVLVRGFKHELCARCGIGYFECWQDSRVLPRSY